MGDEDFVRVNAKEGRHRADGFAAQVHKGGRHQQADIFAGKVNPRGVAEEFTLFAQRRAVAFRQ